jgi:molecular chaperone DnaK (HSP70)
VFHVLALLIFFGQRFKKDGLPPLCDNMRASQNVFADVFLCTYFFWSLMQHTTMSNNTATPGTNIAGQPGGGAATAPESDLDKVFIAMKTHQQETNKQFLAALAVLAPSSGRSSACTYLSTIFSLIVVILAAIVVLQVPPDYVTTSASTLGVPIPDVPVFCSTISISLAAAQRDGADLNTVLEATRRELEESQNILQQETSAHHATKEAAADAKAAAAAAAKASAAAAATAAAHEATKLLLEQEKKEHAATQKDYRTAAAAHEATKLLLEQEKKGHAATKKDCREMKEEHDTLDAINLRELKAAEHAKAVAEGKTTVLEIELDRCYKDMATLKADRIPPSLNVREKMAVEPGWASVSIPANCTSASGGIAKVLWTQDYPKPKTEKKNSLVNVSGFELWNEGAGPSGSLDATLHLTNNVSREESVYKFEVLCIDDFGKSIRKEIEMNVQKIRPPVPTTTEESDCKHPDTGSRSVNPTKVNSAVGRAVFHGCCKEADRKVESSAWIIVKAPAAANQSTFEYDTSDSPSTSRSSKDTGVTMVSGFTVEGHYTLQFTCTDALGKTGTTTHSLDVLPAYSIGIDLGTSTTCVAAFDNDNSPVVVQSYDKRFVDNDPCIPSVVALLQNGTVLVGEAAQAQATLNPANTIYEAKRLMGLSFTDELNANMAYTVRPVCAASDVDCSSATPSISCGSTEAPKMKIFRPELAAALLLKRAKMLAEEKLGVEIVDAVITVPAQFNDVQRKATEDAATIAGLNLLRIINEPTAAALYLGSPETLLDEGQVNKIKTTGKPLSFYSIVADVGGGTTDYSMLHTTIKPCNPKTDKDCSCGGADPSAGALIPAGLSHSTPAGTLCSINAHLVKSTSGDKNLGGRDFNLRLLEYVTQHLSAKFPNVDFTSSYIRQELVQMCEYMKIQLSEEKRVEMPPLRVKNRNGNVEQLTFTMTEEDLKTWTQDLLNRAVAPVRDLMAKYYNVAPESDTARDMSSIKYLYLVGGSLSMPVMQQALLDAYDWNKPIKDRNPKALIDGDPRGFGSATIAVSIGAALYASNIKRKNQILMTDVLANDHSVLVGGSKLDVIIPSGATLPKEETKFYTTDEDGQTEVHVKLFEGSGHACSAEPIADVTISGIPPGPKGTEKINVKVYIPGDGRVEIEAWRCPQIGNCQTSKGEVKLAISSKTGRLPANEVDEWRNILNSIESLNPQHSQSANENNKGYFGSWVESGSEFVKKQLGYGEGSDSHLCDAIPNALELPVNYKTQSRCAQNQLAVITSVNTLLPNGGKLSVVVTVQGESDEAESESGQSVNVDYILIVDTSVSMSGKRIQTAKHALKKLVANLRDNDRVSIVQFGSSASVVQDLVVVGDARSTILQRVESLGIAGSTNMMDGLEMGIQVALAGTGSTALPDGAIASLRATLVAYYTKHNPGSLGNVNKISKKYRNNKVLLFERLEEKYGSKVVPVEGAVHTSGGSSRLQELLLFSDGVPDSNHGLSTLIESKIAGWPTATLHTFGFGEGSVPVLMQELARVGKGEYQYVPENNNNAINQAFARFKVGAGSKSANHVDVIVKLASGVKLTHSLPTPVHVTDTQQLDFKLPPLQKGQPLHMLLQLDVSDASKLGGAINKRQVLSTTMNYVSLTDGSTHNATETVYIKHNIDGDQSGNQMPLLVEEQLQRSMVADKLNRTKKAASPAKYVDEAIVELEKSCQALPSTKANDLRECILKDLKSLKKSISASDWLFKLNASLDSHKNGRGGDGDCYMSKSQKKGLAVYMGNSGAEIGNKRLTPTQQ